MRKCLIIILCISSMFLLKPYLGYSDSFLGSDFLGSGGAPGATNSKESSGPINVTANSMDIDLKNNLITLVGNVVIDNASSKITSDKMLIYLMSKPGESKDADNADAKQLKAIVALGNVVIIRKPAPGEKNVGERKATAGRADYDAVNGVVVLTDHPVLYQGNNYMKGYKITLWKDSDRMIIEGNQSTGTATHVVINQVDTGTTHDTGNVTDIGKLFQ